MSKRILGLLLLGFFASNAYADLSTDLINAVKLGEPPTIPFNLQNFQSLVAQGADVNAQDQGGESVLLLTVIANAYLPDGNADKANLFLAMQLLLQKGANVNTPDNAGLTPLMMAVHRAHCCVTPPNTVPQIKPVYDLLLAQTNPKPDLDFKNTFGESALTYLAAWNEITEMKTFISLGADIYTVDNQGNSLFFTAIGGSKTTTALTPLLTLVPAEKQAGVLSTPNFAKSSPLLEAVRARNQPAVDLLLKQYQVDPNATNEGGENPLSVATDLLSTPRMTDANVALLNTISDSLRAAGAQLPAEQLDEIRCDGPNTGPMDFKRLKSVIETCNANSVDQVVPLLSTQHLSNYLLSYHPRGFQQGDLTHPRVITLGKGGRQIISFNGGGSFTGADSIETIDFNTDGSSQFELHDIQFGNGAPQFSEKNPASCIACHGTNPRPMWDTWYLWPGFYQSEQAAMYPKEREFFAQYVAETQSTGRYKNLLPISDSSYHTTIALDNGGVSAENLRADTEFQDLNSERILNDIASNGLLWPYRYAILGAFSCNDPIEDYIPDSMHSMFPQSFATLLQDTQAKDFQEFTGRVQRQLADLGIDYPQGAYSQDFLQGLQTTGQSYQNDRVSRLRYILENLKQSMDWSMIFSPGDDTYVLPEMYRVEIKLWRRLLSDSREDADALAMFEQQSGTLSAFESSITNGLFRGNDYDPTVPGIDNSQICAELLDLSHAALAH
jgi:ankyrin repeat protein